LVVGGTIGETLSFYYLCIILVLGVFQGLCGVWIIIVVFQLHFFRRYLCIVNTSVFAPTIIPAMAWDHALSIEYYLS
jgi:hypothetical protein